MGFLYSRRYFLLRFFLIILFPFCLTYWVTQPFHPPFESHTGFKTLDINAPQFISTSTLSIIREMATDLLETPLNLGFRKLCIQNKGFISINGNLINQEQSDDLSGTGAVNLEVFIGSSTATFLVKPGRTECQTFKKREENISYTLSEKKFVAMPENSILQKYIEPINDPKGPMYSTVISDANENVIFSYQVSPFDIALKFLMIFVFWNTLQLLLVKLFKCLRYGFGGD